MTDLKGSCFFCEDIRHEVGGSVSLMGVLPHGISVPEFPYEEKLGIFMRLKLPKVWDGGHVRCFVVFPNGSNRTIGVITVEGILAAATEMPKDRDYIEVSWTAVIRVNFEEAGYLRAFVQCDGEAIEMAKLAVQSEEQEPR